MSNVVTTAHGLTQMVCNANEVEIFVAPCSRHIQFQVEVDEVLLLAVIPVCVPKESDELHDQDFGQADDLGSLGVLYRPLATGTVGLNFFRAELL